MCGITGLVDFRYKSSRQILQQMYSSLSHRGPDAIGEYWKSMPSYQIGLGHTRLSLLDDSTLASQPYRWKHWVLVFNGEIYNFREIRHTLQQKGYFFESESDTEVLVKAFDYWGEMAVQQLTGMFAFGLYNQENQQLMLVRDRAGTKPLYVYQSKNVILFGSELKALMAHPDFPRKIQSQSVGLYFQYGYVPSSHCIFEQTHKVRAGQILVIDLPQNTSRYQTYWSILDSFSQPTVKQYHPESCLLHELDQRLDTACQTRMTADHPIGLYLSGGYDSSLVAYYARKHSNFHKAYCLGFEENEYSEVPFAQQIAQYLNIPFEGFILENRESLYLTTQLPEVFDEPFGDSSAAACLALSQRVRSSVKAVVSAEGGDELWAGYPRYVQSLRLFQGLKYAPSSVVRVLLKSFKHRKCVKLRHILSHPQNPLWILDAVSQSLSSNLVPSLVQDFSPNSENTFRKAFPNDPIHAMLYWDYSQYLVDDLMVKADRTGMAVGLEIREPMLHHPWVEWVSSLPSQYKINGSEQKYLLKKLAHQKIPQALLDRPKKGFGVPLSKWLRGSLKELVLDTLTTSALEQHRLLNTATVNRYIKHFYGGSDSYTTTLWHLLQFQLWYNRWL
ncbi:asparagine synthase (glutamine-hydrolyzing) [Flectobacillus roseus]